MSTISRTTPLGQPSSSRPAELTDVSHPSPDGGPVRQTRGSCLVINVALKARAPKPPVGMILEWWKRPECVTVFFFFFLAPQWEEPVGRLPFTHSPLLDQRREHNL